MKASYEICRRHHERYDGKGYPDGLKGDEIPKQPVRRWNGSFQGTEKNVKEDVSPTETKNMELSSLKQVGINTDSAIERFMGNEALFAKMLKKFLAEPTFAKLTAAAAEGNGQAALEASHTLKGVCGNLSIESLFDLFAEQVVLMRADKWDEAYAMMPEITEKYNLVTDTLKSCLDVQ